MIKIRNKSPHFGVFSKKNLSESFLLLVPMSNSTANPVGCRPETYPEASAFRPPLPIQPSREECSAVLRPRLPHTCFHLCAAESVYQLGQVCLTVKQGVSLELRTSSISHPPRSSLSQHPDLAGTASLGTPLQGRSCSQCP